MKYTFLELGRTDGYVTSSSAEDGNSRCTFQLQGVNESTPPAVADLPAFISYLCGGVDNVEPKTTTWSDADAGKIRRRIPKLHPYVAELSVAGVTAITGTGTQVSGDSLQVLGLPPITDQFNHYTAYDYTVEMRRRPYFLLPDNLINRPKRTYYKPDGTGVDYYYAEEWNRYADRVLLPIPDTVNATAGGQMKFRAPGNAIDATQYAGQTWVYMSNQMLEVDWFLVPYRYFWNINGCKSYFSRFINTVNQYELFGFEPGQLLFLGGTPRPYIPQVVNAVNLLGISLAQSQSMLCNCKLRWLVTTRVGSDLPAAGAAGTGNLNRIANGHNLQPSFTDRKFHYVTAENPGVVGDVTKWYPTFDSFPHELFFTDPMLTQPGGAI